MKRDSRNANNFFCTFIHLICFTRSWINFDGNWIDGKMNKGFLYEQWVNKNPNKFDIPLENWKIIDTKYNAIQIIKQDIKTYTTLCPFYVIQPEEFTNFTLYYRNLNSLLRPYHYQFNWIWIEMMCILWFTVT